MRLLRRFLRRLPRQFLAVAALLSQLVVAMGAPAFSPRSAKTGAIPFPCQDHPCGCTTSEQGWAGDCCCFTLEQKLAWAEERGIEPPAHVRSMVEARKAATRKPAAKPSCCAKREKPSCCADEVTAPIVEKPVTTAPAPVVKWTAAVFAQKCRGEGPTGLAASEVSIAPTLAVTPRPARPRSVFARPTDTVARSIFSQPIDPPPRVS